jgi:hypothetical protein
MPYVGTPWPDIDPTIERSYTYDFSLRLAPGDSIASVTWDLSPAPDSVYTSPDPNSNSRLSDLSNTETMATAWLSNCLPLVRYRLTAYIVTALGMKDDLFSYIKCNPIV